MGNEVQTQQRLAVVILNWNDWDASAQAARAALAWSDPPPLVVLVDNASDEDNTDRVQRDLPAVEVLRSEANLGFAGGNNAGIRRALDAGCDAIFLLNNDAEIGPSDVARLRATLAETTGLGIVGPAIAEERDGTTILTCGGRDIAFFPSTRIVINEDTARPPVRPAAYVPGTAVLVRAEVFRAVGLFDEDFFFSGEVADFCERARQAGFGCAVDTRARATHRKHVARAAIGQLHLYYTLRNRFLFVRKHRRALALLLFPCWTIIGALMAVKARLRGDAGAARAAMLALRDGWKAVYGNQNEQFLG